MLAASLLFAVHLGLISYFIGFERALSDEPIQGDDFDTHIGQTYRVLEGLERFGHTWVYDVDLLAGNPAGVIFDADNKGWSIWTYAMTRLGMPKGRAFNSFVLFSHLLPPVCLLWVSLLFGFDRWAALAAAAFSSLLWFFDSFCHWVWWVGMVSYAAGACLSLLPLVLFYRFIEGRRLADGLWCAPLLGFVHLVHPYSFFFLAPPMAAIYLRRWRSRGVLVHVVVVVIVLTTFAINAYWLHNAYTHWHHVQDSAYFGQPGLSYLLADLFNLALNPTDTGVIGTRTVFRFLFLAMAVLSLLRLRRDGDPRAFPLGIALVVLFALAYLGAYIPFAGQVQPYRHVMPLCFVAALLAGDFVRELWLRRAQLRPTGSLAVVCGLLGLLAVQHVAREVMYFVPGSLPAVESLIDGRPAPIGAMGYPPHLTYDFDGHTHVERPVREVVEWVQENIPAGTRIAVERTLLGERLAWKTDVEVIGGFRLRNLAHSYANIFRTYEPRELSAAQLRRYVRTFAISYFITLERRDDFDEAGDVLEYAEDVGGFSIYRTLLPVHFVLSGGESDKARVRASTNRIEVEGTDPRADVTISYHYHEALGCRPDCRVERQHVDDDRVGLIRVPAPHPPSFVVENTYSF